MLFPTLNTPYTWTTLHISIWQSVAPVLTVLTAVAHPQEKEIESLAGKKEGCHDDVEFITVQRNKTLPAGADAPPAALPSSQLLQPLSTSSVDLGHPAEVRRLGGEGVWGCSVFREGSRGTVGRTKNTHSGSLLRQQ
jgi:hypothetical protein